MQRTGRERVTERKTVALAAALGAVVAVGAYLVFPVTPPVDRHVSGDEEIAGQVLDELPYGSAVGVSVLLEEDRRTRTAQLGTRGDGEPVAEGTRFETGSLQKVVTARLLAEMVESGEVELDTTLGEIWSEVDFADPAVADTTLESLATHTSGLPGLPFGADAGLVQGILPYQFFRADPYRAAGDPVEVAASMEDSGAAPDSPHTYSNFGFALLGHSLGHAAGSDYRTAVTERVLEPLGMGATVVPGPGDGPEPPQDAALPFRAPSSPAVQWKPGQYIPSGSGTWSTPEDLSRLLEAAQDTESPVTRLTHEPREAEGISGAEEYDARSGLAWVLWNVDGTELSWHNGGTSGTLTFMGHTDDGRSVVVMADSSKVPAERIGLTLLGLDSSAFSGGGGILAYWGAGVAVFLAVLVPGITLLRVARGSLQRGPLPRANTVAEVAASAAAWVWAFVLGDWGAVPPVVWAVGGGLVTATVVAVVHRWNTMGATVTIGARTRWHSWIMPVLNIVFAVLVLWGTATAISQMP